MDRTSGWLLAGGIVVALGGLWVVAQKYDDEPTPSCAADQPLDEFLATFHAAIDLNPRLPTEEPVVQGPLRRTRSESRDACMLIWADNFSSRAMVSQTAVEIYLDSTAATEAFRYSEYAEYREANADADRFIDGFVHYDVDLSDPRSGSPTSAGMLLLGGGLWR